MSFGWVQELDHANMPDVTANLDPTLVDISWDPGRKYSIPYQVGFTGIAYNSAPPAARRWRASSSCSPIRS